MVTRRYRLDAGSHALDQPGALMAQHDGEWHLPGPHRQVGVADPGPHQAHRHLVISRLLQLQVLDRERARPVPGNRRDDLHCTSLHFSSVVSTSAL